MVGKEAARQALLAVRFYSLTAGFRQRPAAQAIKLSAGLGKLTIVDESRHNEDYCCLVRPRATARKLGTPMPAGMQRDAQLLQLVLETNPLSKVADTALSLRLEPVEICYLPSLFQRLASFFSPPDDLLVLEDLSDAAMSSALALQESGATGLLYAIETHKTVALDMRLGAPTLIVPAKAGLLVVDMGVLTISSDLTAKGQVHLGFHLREGVVGCRPCPQCNPTPCSPRTSPDALHKSLFFLICRPP